MTILPSLSREYLTLQSGVKRKDAGTNLKRSQIGLMNYYLKALKKLLLFISTRDDIDLSVGLIDWVKKEGAKGFEFKQDAFEGKVKGLLTHTNVRKDKFDCFPQAELIDMLLSI